MKKSKIQLCAVLSYLLLIPQYNCGINENSNIIHISGTFPEDVNILEHNIVFSSNKRVFNNKNINARDKTFSVTIPENNITNNKIRLQVLNIRKNRCMVYDTSFILKKSNLNVGSLILDDCDGINYLSNSD